MQRLEVSGAVRPIYGSLGVKRLNSPSFKERALFVGSRTRPEPDKSISHSDIPFI